MSQLRCSCILTQKGPLADRKELAAAGCICCWPRGRMRSTLHSEDIHWFKREIHSVTYTEGFQHHIPYQGWAQRHKRGCTTHKRCQIQFTCCVTLVITLRDPVCLHGGDLVSLPMLSFRGRTNRSKKKKTTFNQIACCMIPSRHEKKWKTHNNLITVYNRNRNSVAWQSERGALAHRKRSAVFSEASTLQLYACTPNEVKG